MLKNIKAYLYFALVLLILTLTACNASEELELSNLVERNDLYYKINDEKPFSGAIVDFFNKEQDFKKEYAQIKDGQRHGKYQSWYENQQVKLDGEYKQGKRDGEWIEYYDNGQIKTKGNYLDDKKNGQWSEWFKGDVLVYEGNYENDQKNGYGKDYNTEGDIRFEGTFKESKAWDGFLNLPVPNQYLFGDGNYAFKGEIKDGHVWNGNGIEYNGEDLVYEGEFQNGKYNKKGILSYTDNEAYAKNRVYEGEFVDGVKHGNGIVYWGTYVDKVKQIEMVIIFEGELKNGMHWNGVEFPNHEAELLKKGSSKEVFTGEIREGKVYKGKLFYSNGLGLGKYYDEYIDGVKGDTYMRTWNGEWVRYEE